MAFGLETCGPCSQQSCDLFKCMRVNQGMLHALDIVDLHCTS